MTQIVTDATDSHAAPSAERFWPLALGAIGVVFGDIGTSPLYAMREALAHSRSGGTAPLAVLGVVSLVTWALILVVTLKYVVFLMRADNKGEGGTLALMALARRALAKSSAPLGASSQVGPSPPYPSKPGNQRPAFAVLVLGILGAAFFYADGIITPAVSVLGAMEGLREVPKFGTTLSFLIMPLTIGVLVSLFMVQSRGTASVARWFGPITALWFLTLAGLGLFHIRDDPGILRGLSPHYGALFLLDNGMLGFAILGSVFLAVTGAEALYADMGHFGKTPIRIAWLGFVLPCLLLNYLGQGALVLSHPEARSNPFFQMIPQSVYWPVWLLSIAATVIASQAVITGAFSMTQQAVQLGLLPRIVIRRTSETQAGQIFVPGVNTVLLIGVLMLLVMFKTSSNLAAAYGIAVTGAMLVDSLLFFVIIRRLWNRPLWNAVAALVVFGGLDVVFVGANLLKIPQGAWLPLLLAGGLVTAMLTWARGARRLAVRAQQDTLPLASLAQSLAAKPPHRTRGTAIFLTSEPAQAPLALLHNLKHNNVLHAQNIILTVRTAATPRVDEATRLRLEPVDDAFKILTVTYGFMETPNLPQALNQSRRLGLKFDIMETSFFLGRRTIIPSPKGMPIWQDKLFAFMMGVAANPTSFFRIPPGRVVEMGTQTTV
jgi:KUP system potassium uptake protein